jgi:hypothetical protein
VANVEVKVQQRDFELVEIDSDHLKATACNMLFMIWRRESLAEPFRRSVALVEQLAKKSKSQIGVCQLVEPEAIAPDAAGRAAFTEILQLDSIAHSSVTHDGTGFKAASVRAIVNLQILLGKPKFPHRIFSTVAEATTWHAEMQTKLGRTDSAARLAFVVKELRALHRERYP